MLKIYSFWFFFFSFQCTTGSLPVRRRAGCYHHDCVHQRWDPITTSVTSSRASDEEAAHALSSWTTDWWATVVTEAKSVRRRPRREPSSGRGTSQASGRGNASWTERKRDSMMGKERAQATGAETWTTKTISNYMAMTAAKTFPRLFMRNTMSPAMMQIKMMTQRVFMTLYPQPDQPMKGTRQAPQASTCIQLNSCPLSGHGTYRLEGGGGRRRMAVDSAPAISQVLGTN